MASIDRYDFPPGRMITSKYRVIEMLGRGYEGEVYKIVEESTGITRAAKVFYPQRNVKGKAIRLLAQKLHKLRDCPILIQYHNQETITVRRTPVSVMISEFIEGEPLSDFLDRQRGKYLGAFQAVHLLYALVDGVADIHAKYEYHGDLHTSNIIVSRFGLGFSLKLIDFYHWDSPKAENRREDIIDMVRVFYDALGGQKRYARQPDTVKYICCGLKRSLILKKFPTAVALRNHLQSMRWD
ncbi:MAG: protein kinase [Gammaproteobacteria bacterium]|nr:protein kinase [Gammaproteobacteria bacterium]